MITKWLAGVGLGTLCGAACTIVFYILEQNGTVLPNHVTTAITALVMAAVGLIFRVLTKSN